MMKFILLVLIALACCLAGSLSSLTPLSGQFEASDLRDANPPSDLSIVLNVPLLILSWTAVPSATGYKVEASELSTEGFEDVSASGTFNLAGGTHTWTGPASAVARFYRVRSISASIPSNFASVGAGMFHNGTSEVYISAFYMDKYELTQGAFLEVMGYDPAWEYGDGANIPVYNVSWFNAIAYCNKRSITEGLTPCYAMTGYGTNVDTWPPGWANNYPYDSAITCDWTAGGYRMPTEAEWEYAARGGNLSQGYTYSGSNTLSEVGWPSNAYPQNIHVGGGKLANELGIFDMSGNVWEHCWDVVAAYPTGEQINPHGPGGSGHHIFRGGSVQSPPEQCTVNARAADYPHNIHPTRGFRICMNM